jgi:hypothetical protein
MFRDALAFTEDQLFSTISFMNSRDLLHFDTHFENILTDGRRLYFNDFGLALSTEFDLSDGEMEFLRRHRDYDRCRASVGFMHAVTTAVPGQDNWNEGIHSPYPEEHFAQVVARLG